SVTLFRINLLYRSSAPSSRSLILHSNTFNCSSLQTTETFFWNALKTIDDLGVAICFARSCTVDSRREVVISLASLKSLMILQSSLSWTMDFNSAKSSCMELQRSNSSRELSISASNIFLCWKEQTWLLGRHISSSMEL
ncbi:hypothetical protein U9M48_015202, partial [Paspalum notatum var. saurae]